MSCTNTDTGGRVRFFENDADRTADYRHRYVDTAADDDGVCSQQDVTRSVRRWLRENPHPGPYTTARVSVVGDDLRVFRLDAQLSRVHRGLRRLCGVDDDVDDRVRSVLRRACRALLDDAPDLTSLRVTLRASVVDGATTLWCVAEPMPGWSSSHHGDAVAPRRHPRDPVAVVVRKNVVSRVVDGDPTVKDSRFVTDRRILERCQGTAEETVMAAPGSAGVPGDGTDRLPDAWRDTELLEGGSSNFFAVYQNKRNDDDDDDTTYTIRTAATDLVLDGTVRQVVRDAFVHKDKKISFDDSRPPRLDDLDDWVGCFLTSTSRLVLPIDRLVLPRNPSSTQTVVVDGTTEATRGIVVEFDATHPVLRTIVRAMHDRVLAESGSL